MANEFPTGKQLDPVKLALPNFDFSAPLGQYKVDKHIDKWWKVRGRECLPSLRPAARVEHFLREMRKVLVYSCSSGIRADRHRHVEHPQALLSTDKYIASLREIQKQIRTVKQTNVEELSCVLAHLPSEGRGATVEEEVIAIEDNASRVIEKLSRLEREIQWYLDDNVRPQFLKSPPHTDHFMTGYIARLIELWPRLVGAKILADDLPYVTAIIASSLEDFKYPLSKAQRSSDVWLTDRIRKQIRRK